MPTLSSVCEEIFDCEHKTAPTVDVGYPSVRTPNIGKGYFIFQNMNYVDQNTYEQWTRRTIQKANDLIFAREAPVGNIAIIPENFHPCLGQRTVLIRPDIGKVNPHYLMYNILSDEMQGQIRGITNGATVHHLNVKDIKELEIINWFNRDIQDKIAIVLRNYDSLIENNNRRIAILEEMAQKLYREWFVHFRFPGHESVKMVESEMGLIPEGWTAGRVRDLLDYSRGKSYSSQDLNGESGIPFINLKNIQAYGGFREDGTKLFSGKFKTNQVVKNKDIVMAVTDMTQERRLVGQVAQISNISDYAVISMDLIKLVPHDVRTTDYIYAMFRHSGISAKISEFANGANVLHLNPEVVKEQPCVVPKAEVMIMFQKYISEMLNMVGKVSAQNTNLRKTRDLLLPCLISGDIDVSELDIPIKEG